jgi:hypothetical protein
MDEPLTGRPAKPPLRNLPLLLLLAPAPVFALDVQEVRWGFDGRVVPERVNVLSVLLTNKSGSAYDEVVTLHKTDALGQGLGAAHVEACFVAPFTSRWVQFYPYISGDDEHWVLTLGKQQKEMPSPRLGAPAVVCLSDLDDPFQRPAALHSFLDALFPTTVSATDGLHSLVVDYAPRWERPRRQALLDWLCRGGILHLLPGANGEFPQFSAELSVLNNPAQQFRVGVGLVVRHRVTRSEANEQFLSARGFPLLRLKSGNRVGPWRLEDGFFQALKGLVRPKHNWPVIYLTLFCYLVLVGPVNYLIGRKSGFGRAVVFFFMTTAASACLLGVLGRRGYGETAAIHSLSYARSVGADQYDVTQWINVFVEHGDYYTLSHPGDHNIYSTCQDFEKVNGVLQSGVGGQFAVDIPVFSSRPFLHRGKMKGGDLGVKVAEWRQTDTLEKLTLSVGPGFPEKVAEMWALYHDRFYEMSRSEGRIRVDSYRGTDLATFLSPERVRVVVPVSGSYSDDSNRRDADSEQVLRGMVRPLIGRSIGGTESFSYYLDPAPPSADRVQLFIFAESPNSFALVGKGLGREKGYVLYHLDVLRPEDPNG